MARQRNRNTLDNGMDELASIFNPLPSTATSSIFSIFYQTICGLFLSLRGAMQVAF